MPIDSRKFGGRKDAFSCWIYPLVPGILLHILIIDEELEMNLTTKLKLLGFSVLVAPMFPALAADSYCPQTITCKIPDGSVFSGTCDAPAGWTAKPFTYQGTIPAEVTLNFYSAQSYPNYSPPGSTCYYFYQQTPGDFTHNILGVGMGSSKSFAPPPPAGYWVKDNDPIDGGDYYWCYSKFANPIAAPASNDAMGCPFVVIGAAHRGGRG
jgi:hypothetical protein